MQISLFLLIGLAASVAAVPRTLVFATEETVADAGQDSLSPLEEQDL